MRDQDGTKDIYLKQLEESSASLQSEHYFKGEM